MITASVMKGLMANSTDPTSSIMYLKFNYKRELYTTDLPIYSQLAHLKNIDKFGFKKV